MHIDKYIEETRCNLESINNIEFINLIEEASRLIITAFVEGGSVLICGNGGSHSDAQHFAGELVNFFTRKHKALSVITLGTNSTVSSAWANDHNFEDQFAREVQAYGSAKSIFLGITTSGKSANVNNAFIEAKNLGMKTIALASEKAIANLPNNIDLVIPVPVQETHKIQEIHIVVYHAICILVEENLPSNFLN